MVCEDDCYVSPICSWNQGIVQCTRPYCFYNWFIKILVKLFALKQHQIYRPFNNIPILTVFRKIGQ